MKILVSGFLWPQIFTEMRPVVFFFGGAEPAIAEDFVVSIFLEETFLEIA